MKWKYSGVFKLTDSIVGYIEPFESESGATGYKIQIKLEQGRFLVNYSGVDFEKAKDLAEKMIREIINEGMAALNKLANKELKKSNAN